MLRNIVTIALRNLKRNKAFSTINIAGLAVGMAACLLIFLYVEDELSYDTYHAKADRIYRLAADVEGASYENGIAKVADLWGPGVKAELAEVEDQTRFVFYGQTLVERGEHRQYEAEGMYADSATFSVFSWEMLQGDPETALVGPDRIVVSSSFAKRWFGNENPMGQTLRMDNNALLTVSGVMRDVPANSHFTFDFLVSLESYVNDRRGDWISWNQFYTYVLLAPGAVPAAVADRIDAVLDRHLEPETAAAYYPLLQPLPDIHLHSKLHRELAANSDVRYVYIFSTIALFILLIACTNFVSLSTARASRRAQEVGVRKVSGANRSSLIRQFIGESILLCGIAMAAALMIAFLFLDGFNSLAGKNLASSVLTSTHLIVALVVAVGVVGVAAGVYPAFVLSSFRPVTVLKGGSGYHGGAGLRKSLVVFQFAVSACLLIATGVVFDQLSYIENKDLGFNKEQIIIVPTNEPSSAGRYETIKSQLLAVPGVVSASFSANRPGGSDWGIPVDFEGIPDDKEPAVRMLCVDHDFIETYGIEVIEGRGFSRDFPADTATYILNETAARALGWTVAESGRIGMPVVDRAYGEVVGIVKDFHFRSMHERIGPLIMFIKPAWLNTFNIRIRADDEDRALAGIERVMARHEPTYPFVYRFFDEQFDRLHVAEARTGALLAYFTGLAVFIAVLGLLGLASFTAERRTKEIGIRKVFGASLARLVAAMNKEFALLVALGGLVSIPVTWMLMSRWLESFAYRIELGFEPFVVSLAVVGGIGLLTVSYHAVRAAAANPIESLRYE